MTFIFFIFSICVLVQVSYWFFFYVNITSLNETKIDQKLNTSDVSIIICVKNEVQNIKKHFHTWRTQLGPNDHLFIVDDYSEDKSFNLASSLCSGDASCSILQASKDRPGKKQALSDAIMASSNEFILVTDADCHPKKNWKKRLFSLTDPRIDFVLGYAPFYKEKSVLNLFQRFECLLTAMHYFSFAKAGMPYMGVGRSMMFRKSVFDTTIYSSELASGDDDLLVSARARSNNTALCVDKGSFVYSAAKDTLGSYLRQKIRHISTSTQYKPKVKLLLSLFSFAQICGNLLFIPLLISGYWRLALAFQVVKYLSMFLSTWVASAKFYEGKIHLFAPILDILLTFYYVILSICYPFKNKKHWN